MAEGDGEGEAECADDGCLWWCLAGREWRDGDAGEGADAEHDGCGGQRVVDGLLAAADDGGEVEGLHCGFVLGLRGLEGVVWKKDDVFVWWGMTGSVGLLSWLSSGRV